MTIKDKRDGRDGRDEEQCTRDNGQMTIKGRRDRMDGRDIIDRIDNRGESVGIRALFSELLETILVFMEDEFDLELPKGN
jgi:hypothetical protein